MRRAALIALALAALLGLLGGCGGGSGSGGTRPTAATETEPAPSDRGYVAGADRACRRLLASTRRLGRRFIAELEGSADPDLPGSVTKGLIKPGLGVLEETAAKLRAIEAKHPDPTFSVYVETYEPLLQLAKLRLEAGEAGETAEAKNIELQMEEIGAEQRALARQAGIADCKADFLRAMVQSWVNR